MANQARIFSIIFFFFDLFKNKPFIKVAAEIVFLRHKNLNFRSYPIRVTLIDPTPWLKKVQPKR